MNGPFQVAQANIAGQSGGKPPARIVKIAKPFSEQSVVVALSYDGSVKADLSAIAGEKITLVHIGEKLIILFDNKSTVTLEPFFDSTGKPLNGISVEVSPGRDLTGAEFAATFPVTEDQSVLPAAGDGNGNAQASGANFSSVGVDPLALPGPLDLLGQEELPNFVINDLLGPNVEPNRVPFQIAGAHVGGVTEEEQLGGFISERPSVQELLNQLNWVTSGGKEDPNDVTLPNSDGASSDGLDQDTPEDLNVTTQHFHGAGADALTNLVSSGNPPLTFTIDTGIPNTPVIDGTGAVVKSAGHELQYSAIDTTVAGDSTVVGGYGGEGGFHEVFRLTIHSDGTYDFELLDKIDHPDHTTDNGSTSNGHLEETLFIDFTTLVHVSDVDGDNFTLNSPGAFTIGVIDDTPEVHVSAAEESSLSLATLDESVGTDLNDTNAAADDTNDAPPKPFGEQKTADFSLADLFSVNGTTGEDGFGSVDYAFTLVLGGKSEDGGVATSLSVTDPTGHYTDAKIYLFSEGADIVGRVGGPQGDIALRISIENPGDPVTGHFVVDQYLPIDHGSDNNNFDTSLPLTLSNEGTLGITLTATVTDGDGDVATSAATVTIIDGETTPINIEDDGPTITAGEGGEIAPLAVLDLDETIGADRYNTNETESEGGASNGADDKSATVTVSTDQNLAANNAIGELTTGNGALAGLFTNASIDFGTDGPGANGGITKHLDLVLSSEHVGTSLTATALVGTSLANMTAAQRAIELVQIDSNTLVGRLVGDGNPATDDQYIAFRITLSNADDPANAKITVDQFLAIDHGGSESPSVFDEQALLTLIGNSTLNLKLTTTVTDGDGDHASLPVEVTLIGGNSSFIAFDDDGPTVTASKAEGFTLVHDETLLLQSPPFGDDNDILFTSVFNSVSNPGHDPDVPFGLPIGYARSAGSALSAPVIDYGTDGAAAGAAAKVYSLSLFDANGAAASGPIDSKIETTDHHEIFLFKEGNFIVGRYDTADGEVTGADPAAFALYMDPATGVVSVVQYVSLHHNSPDIGVDSDEYVSLGNALGSVQATVTVTDGDGDKASASANISDDVRFEDDGPSVVATVKPGFGITADESTGNQNDDVTGPLTIFAGVTNVGHDPDNAGNPLAFATDNTPALAVLPYFGVDGPATANPVAYSLTLNGGDGKSSGLKLTDGTTISLFVDPSNSNIIVGRVDSGPLVGQAAFAVAIDPSTGQVSVVEYLSIQHNLNGANPNDQVSLANNTILATVTITDGDGDTASASADISGKIRFNDDGPTLTVSTDVSSDDLGVLALNLDETIGKTGSSAADHYNTGETESGGGAQNGVLDDTSNKTVTLTTDSHSAAQIGELKSSQGALSNLFAPAIVNYGADGPSANSLTSNLSLVLTGTAGAGYKTNLVATALAGGALAGTSVAHRTVWLTVEDGQIVGRIGHDTAGTGDDYVVLRISLSSTDPATAQLIVDQFLPIDHDASEPAGFQAPENPSQFDEAISLLMANTGQGIGVKLTVTATDGDNDSVTKTATANVVSNGSSIISFDDDGPTPTIAATNGAANGLFFDGFVPNNDAWGAGSGINNSGTAGAWHITASDYEGASTVQLERVGDGYRGADSPTNSVMVDMEATPGNVQVTQDLTLTPGALYHLTFEIGAANDPGIANSAKLEVFWNGVSVGTYVPLSGLMQTISIDVAAAGANNQLTFKEVGEAGDNTGTFLANVKLSDVIIIDETMGVDPDSDDTTGLGALFTTVTNGGPVGVDPNMDQPQYAQGKDSVVATGVADYGTDGPAATNPRVIGLSVSSAGVDSGLTTTEGKAIHLYVEGSLVVGRYDSDNNGSYDTAAFALTIDPNTGILSIAQYVSLHHPIAGQNDEGVYLNGNTLLATVTLTDGDGDHATSSADISSAVRFEDDGPSINPAQNSSLRDWTVDEDVLPAAGHTTPVGNDALDNPSDTNDYTLVNDKPLGVTWGADGPKSLTFAAMDSQHPTITITDGNGVPQPALTSGGVPLVYDIQTNPDGGQTLIAYRGSISPANQIFTLTLDPDAGTGGTFSFELTGALDHPAGNGQNTLNLQFGFTATDGDNDTATSSLTFRITDDVPYLTSPYQNANLILNGSFEDHGPVGNPGFNTFETINHWTSGPDNVPFEIQQGNIGDLLPQDGNAKVELDSDPINNPTSQLNATIQQTISTPLNAGDSFELSFWYSPRPNDGNPDSSSLKVYWNGVVVHTIDSSTQTDGWQHVSILVTAQAGSNTVAFQGDGQANQLGAYIDNVSLIPAITVDEDGLTGPLSYGNHDSQPGDNVVPNTEGGGQDNNEATATGNLNIKWGADDSDSGVDGFSGPFNSLAQDKPDGIGDRSVTFTNANVAVTGVPTLYSKGELVKFVLNDDHTLLIGVAGTGENARTVFEVSLSDEGTGQFRFVLLDKLDHAPGNNENDIGLSFNYTATDSDGDAVSGSFFVGVDDDTPVANTRVHITATVDEDGLLWANADGNPLRDGETDGTESATFTGAAGALTTLVNFGADGPGAFRLVAQDPTEVTGLFSKTQQVLIVSDGTTLTGYVESGNGAGFSTGDREIFTLTVGIDGSYVFTLKDQIDHPTLNNQDGDNGENLLAATGIDLSSFVVATDGDGDPVTLGAGAFTVQILDDIPVVAARPGVDTTTTTTTTVTNAFNLHAGNVEVRGVGQGGHDLLLTTASGHSVNTTSGTIGVDNAWIDGVGKKNGAEFVDAQFVTNLNLNDNSFATHDQQTGASFSLDLQGNGTGVLFVGAATGGIGGGPVDLTFKVNGTAVTATVVAGGYVLSGLDDGDKVSVTAVTGTFDTLKIGNYDGVSGFEGGPFRVYGLGSDVTTTVTTTTHETFTVSEDESAGLNTSPDPNSANDVNAPASGTDAYNAIFAANAIGYAKSGESVLVSNGAHGFAALFTGKVGADLDGEWSFAITDKDGAGFAGIDSGLTTLDHTNILLTTDADGALVGKAGNTTVFKVYVDHDGFVWIAQYDAIYNPASGFDAAAYDDIAKIAADLHIKGTLTDADGDSVSAVSDVSLQVQFQDDGPVAVSDAHNLGTQTSITANVITGANETSPGVDTVGTDGAKVTDVTSNNEQGHVATNVNGVLTIVGEYGTLVLNPDGGYTYQRANGAPLTGSDVFTYTLTDGDGDIATATLTININDHGVSLSHIGAEGGDVVVNESALSASRGQNESAGTSPDAPALTQSGTFTITAPDQLGNVTIDNHAIVANGVFTATSFTTALGNTFAVTAFDGTTVSYTYTLLDNEQHQNVQGNNPLFENLQVDVSDSDGDTASALLTVNITDDNPAAHNDGPYGVVEDGAGAANTPPTSNISGNVLGNDTPGADGLTGVVAWAAGNAAEVAELGTYGTLALNANGTWSFDLNNSLAATQALIAGQVKTYTLDYTITDNDGDTSPATLTITITGTDDTPTLTVPAAGGDGTLVSEAGLPARGGEPAGSDSLSNSEITTGSFSYTNGDGASTVTINGQALATGANYTGAHGTLHIDSIVGTTVNYTYTLTDNVDNDSQAPTDSFAILVSDSDGNPADDASASLVINITDDNPAAHNDGPYGVVEDGAGAANTPPTSNISGNVLGNDTPGADGLTGVVAWAAGNAAEVAELGTYGTLALNANGTWSFDLNNSLAATQALIAGQVKTYTLDYTITDNDGDTSPATLTITITGTDDTPTLTVPAAGGDGTLVSEAGLPARGGEPAGSDSLSNSEITTGSFSYTNGDGASTVTINGQALATGANYTGAHGTLHIDSIVGTTVNYTYTLTDNVDNDSQAPTDSFAILVSDSDGNPADDASASLVINITDDNPAAHNDGPYGVVEDGAGAANTPPTSNISGNVLGNDTPGADGLTGVVAWAAGNAAEVAELGTYGTLALNANGTWSFDLNNSLAATQALIAGQVKTYTLDYTITDNDGDTSPATLTITITGTDDTPTLTVPAAGGDGTLVSEAGLPARGGEPAGSDSLSNSEITTGSFSYTNGDGASTVTINGQALATGANYTGAHGTLHIDSIVGTTVNYTYTLTDNVDNDSQAPTDSFAILVSDSDGNPADDASASLVINITDDNPAAHNDGPYGVVEDGAGAANTPPTSNISGNVLGNDTPGADGLTGVVAWAAGNAAEVAELGTYGTLALNANGTWSFDLNNSLAATQALIAGQVKTYTLDYTITDNDGDTSPATLTITITGTDDTPTLTVPAAGGDGTLVSEAGLPARGGEPAGSDSLSNSEITTGSFSYTNGDGASTVTINGQALATGANYTGAHGTLHIDSIVGTTVNYTYTLTDNVDNDSQAPTDSFAILVSDSDGNPADDASASLVINITDDNPAAHNDGPYGVVEDGAGAANTPPTSNISGNVLGNDTPGADGLTGVVAWAAGNAAEVAELGTYGTLALNANGTWSFDLNNSLAATQALIAGQVKTYTLDYTITDNDGDTSPATLTITITGTDDTPTLTVPAAGGDGTLVSEAGLPARGGEPAGSDSLSNSEITTGSFSYTNGDGASTVTINGQALATGANYTGAHGTLHIDSIVGTTVNYTYTLTDNVDNDSQAPTDSFAILVSDSDGNPADDASASLVINITDDNPAAYADTDSVASGSTSTTGNVFTGIGGGDGTESLQADTIGADGPDSGGPITGVAAGSLAGPVNGNVGNVITTAKGTLVLNANGSYTYTSNGTATGNDVFTYTIKDGDGDTATTTLTITIENTVPTVTGSVSLSLAEAALDTIIDATAPATDLHAGVVTGTNPSLRAETAQATSGLTFTATGESINVGFVNPSASGWVAPTFTGLQSGYTLSWSLVGAELVGHLISPTSVDLGAFVYLSLSGTLNASAGGTVTPIVTATLVDNLNHSGTSVSISNIQVAATDTSGDKVYGSVNLTISDDAPLFGVTGHTPDHGVIADQPASKLIGDLNVLFGADGPASSGALSLANNVAPSNLLYDGSHKVLYSISGTTLTGYADMDNSGTQNTGDVTVFTLSLNPVTDEYTFTLNAPFTQSTQIGGTGTAYGSGPAQQDPLTITVNSVTTQIAIVSTTASHQVNGATGGWGVDNANFDKNEFLRFDFTDGAVNSPTPDSTFHAASPVFADFTFSKNGSVTYNVHYTDGSMTGNTTVNETGSLHLGVTGKVISFIDFTANDGLGKLDLVHVDQVYGVSQDLSFNVTATDGDGDSATGQITIHVAGNSVLQGTADADVLAAGLNTSLTGGDSADHFLFTSASATGTHITDFSGSTGVNHQNDVIELLGSIFGAASWTAGNVLNETIYQGNDAASAILGASQHFAYNSSTGNLYYDANGGAADANRILLAVLDNHAALTATDVHKV